MVLSRIEPLVSVVVIDEGSGPRLDVGLATVPEGHGVVVPFDKGNGTEVELTLLIVSDTPVGNGESCPNGVPVVLAVGNGGWLELIAGGSGACVPVPRLTLLPGGMPCPEGIPGEAVCPILPVVFEIGKGAETVCGLAGPPASLLLPVETTVDESPVTGEPVTAGLVGLDLPVEFESGNGAGEALLCNGCVGFGTVVEFRTVTREDSVEVQVLGFDVLAVPGGPLVEVLGPVVPVAFDRG